MAIEDAAVLGNLLSRLSSRAEILPLLRGYEALRHARTAETQASSRLNQKIFHLEDGAEQEARDADMRAARDVALTEAGRGSGSGSGDGGDAAGSANQWADKAKSREQFRYDADAEAERWWREKGERMCRHLKSVSARM